VKIKSLSLNSNEKGGGYAGRERGPKLTGANRGDYLYRFQPKRGGKQDPGSKKRSPERYKKTTAPQPAGTRKTGKTGNVPLSFCKA